MKAGLTAAESPAFARSINCLKFIPVTSQYAT